MRIRNTTPQKRGGMVLLIVLAILGLLSILAISFVQMARLERSISRNYVDRTRAILAAESGVEYALSRIRNFHGGALRPDELADLRWSDAQASFHLPGEPLVSGYIGSETGAPTDVSFRLQVDDESGKLNLNDTNGAWNIDTDPHEDFDDPLLGDVDDINESWPRLTKLIELLVDTLNPSQPGLGGLTAAALMDAREQLYNGRFASMSDVKAILVDGGILSPDQFEEFSRNVTLTSWQDPNTLKPSFKARVSLPAGATQPDDNFDIYLWADYQTDEYELEPRCPVNVNACSVELLQALIQPLQGWYLKEGPADTSTTHFYSAWMGGCSFSGMSNIQQFQQFYHVDNPDLSTSSVDGQPCYRRADGTMVMTDGRFPLQWGALASLFDIEHGGRIGNAFGALRRTVSFTVSQARDVAEAIVSRVSGGAQPRPFQTWEEFHDFLKNRDGAGLQPGDILPPDSQLEVTPDTTLDVLPSAWQPWWRQYYFEIYTDLLIAMFNPNAGLNDFNPNRNAYRRVDKGQLTSYSTELSFSLGTHYSVRSTGIVQGAGGATSSVDIHAAVQVFELWRATTQKQFHLDLSDGDTPDRYFSRSDHSPFATWGAAELDATGVGYQIQSYPEPWVPDSPEHLRRSAFDGQLMLATREFYDPSFGPLCLQASYGKGLKPHVFGNNPGSPTVLGDLQTDDLYLNAPGHPDSFEAPATGQHVSEGYNYPTAEPLTWRRKPSDPAYDASAAGLPGVLYPDGGFSEAGRTIGYRSANLFCNDTSLVNWEQAYRYTVSFWCKPVFSTSLSNRVRKILCPEESHWRGLTWLNDSIHGLYYMPHHFTWQDNVNRQLPWMSYPSYLTSESFLFDPAWMAPHALTFFLHGGSYHNNGGNYNQTTLIFGGMTSNRTCNDFAERDASAEIPGVPRINFVDHSWNYCSYGYDLGNGVDTYADWPSNYAFQTINGWTAQYEHYQIQWQSFPPTGETWPDYRLALRAMSGTSQILKPNYLRFGEFNTAYTTRYMADSTFDELVVYPVADLSFGPILTEYWNEGRYTSVIDADGTAGVYTSPVYTVRDLAAWGSERMTVHDVSWTLYWPRNNRAVDPDTDLRDAFDNNVQGVDVNTGNEDDPTLPGGWDPVSVDLRVVDETSGKGRWIGEPSTGQPDKSIMPAGAAGSRVVDPGSGQPLSLGRGQGLQFRIYFNLGDNSATPLYESPVFDDITFLLMPARPRILQWQVVQGE